MLALLLKFKLNLFLIVDAIPDKFLDMQKRIVVMIDHRPMLLPLHYYSKTLIAFELSTVVELKFLLRRAMWSSIVA